MDDFSEKLNRLMRDPDAMSQILSLAHSLGTDASAPPSPPQSDAPPKQPEDDRMLQALLHVMQEARTADRQQETLLAALKPYLSPQHQGKLDRAMQLARLSHLAGYALKNFEHS